MGRCIRKISTSLIIKILILITAVSCNREFNFGFKDLCFYHPHTAPVSINVDWSKFKHIEQPTGMTVYVWPQDPDESMYRFVTHNLNAVNMDLEAGLYNAFIFNQTDSEYATIEFYNLEDYDKAEARVKQVKSSHLPTKLPITKLGSEPEWLAIDCLEDIEVTEEMVAIAEQEYLAGLEMSQKSHARTISKAENNVGTLLPTSIIKNVTVYVHLENMPFLRSAIGALEGMAEGCYISSRTTTSTDIAHAIEVWGVEYEKDENGADNVMQGAIKSSISTFGIPSDHTGAESDNNLYVKLLLVDNSTILEMDFPIGDQLAEMNDYDGTQIDENGKPIWPEIHVYWPEPLPEVEPVGGSGGAFDVGVGEWGDEIITELPLM